MANQYNLDWIVGGTFNIKETFFVKPTCSVRVHKSLLWAFLLGFAKNFSDFGFCRLKLLQTPSVLASHLSRYPFHKTGSFASYLYDNLLKQVYGVTLLSGLPYTRTQLNSISTWVVWQYIAPDKVLFFNWKVLIFFLFLHKNLSCGYCSASNEYPQHIQFRFSRRSRKNIMWIPLLSVGLVGWGKGVYLASPGRPTDSGLLLGKAMLSLQKVGVDGNVFISSVSSLSFIFVSPLSHLFHLLYYLFCLSSPFLWETTQNDLQGLTCR